MAFEMDLSCNAIKAQLTLDYIYPEEAATALVTVFKNFGSHATSRLGFRTTVKHVEMSVTLFDRIVQLNKEFPAFRATSYRALRSRGILGMICGHKIHQNDEIDDCSVLFMYKDVQINDDSGLVDPTYIAAPKSMTSPYVNR